MKIEINIEKKYFYILALIIVLASAALITAYTDSTLNPDGTIPARFGYHELRYISNGSHSVDADEDGIIDLVQVALSGAGYWSQILPDIYYNIGNVGIGTSTPGRKLVIKEASGDRDNVLVIDSGDATNVNISAVDFFHNGAAKWGIGKGTSNNFYIDEFGVGNRLTILQGGYVGIGTTSPTRALHVADASGEFIASGESITLKTTNADLQYPYIEWRSPTNVRGMYMGWGVHGIGGRIDMVLENSNSLSIRGGNVGIGTTSPTFNLEIDGERAGILDTTNNIAVYFDTSDSLVAKIIAEKGDLTNTDRDLAFFSTPLRERMRIKGSSGNVGIGTTSPNDKLTVDGALRLIPRTSSICDTNHEGAIYYDSDDDMIYICKNGVWDEYMGPQGPQGPTGPSGADGGIGPQGATGAIGPQGPVGPVGAVGPQGSVGAVGPQGSVGAVGPQGSVGAVGSQGPQGSVGPQGPAGPPGPAVSTSAVCVIRSVCSCPGGRLISRVGGFGWCEVTSDTGSCRVSGCGLCFPTYSASCCVCSP